MNCNDRVPTLIFAALSVLFATQSQAETLVYIAFNPNGTETVGYIDSAAPGTDITPGGPVTYTLGAGEGHFGSDVDEGTNRIFMMAKNGANCRVYRSANLADPPVGNFFTAVSSVFTCPAGLIDDVFSDNQASNGYRLLMPAQGNIIEFVGTSDTNATPAITTLQITNGGASAPNVAAIDSRPNGDSTSGAFRGIDVRDSTFVTYTTNTATSVAESNPLPLGFQPNFNALTLDKSTNSGVYYLLANSSLRTVNPSTGATTVLGTFGTTISEPNTISVMANAVTSRSGGVFVPASTATANCGASGTVAVAVDAGTLAGVSCGNNAPYTPEQLGGTFSQVGGAINYRITGLTATGQAVRVRLTNPAGGPVNAVFKCTVTSGVCGGYSRYTADSASGAEIFITLTDGSSGDTDTVAREITDPIIIGNLTAVDGRGGAMNLLLLLPMLGLAVLFRRRKA